MLVCNVSLRPPRTGIAADITESAAAVDDLGSGSGQVVFATLVDDPASVGDLVDAYLGAIMVETATADAIADASMPAVYSVAVNETATATDALSSPAAFTPANLTGLVGWWDASVTASLTLSGLNILAMADQSGGGNTLSWIGFGKPVYAATGFNSKPAFVLIGSGVPDPNAYNAFQNTSFPLGTGNTLTCWYVGNLDSAHAQNDCGIISYTGAGQSADYSNVNSFVLYVPSGSTTLIGFTRLANMQKACAANANHRVIVTIDSSGVMTFYIDGVAQTPATAAGNWTSPGILNIGRSKNEAYWAGPVGELGIATGYSDATTVAQLDTYLKTKWGL